MSHIAISTRPDSSCVSAQLAQTKRGEETAKEVRLPNSAIKHIQDNPRGTVFPELDKESLIIRGYSDASFTSNADLTSQLWMIILLSDATGNSTTVHYACCKSRRVTRYVLAAEVYAFSACYDYAYTFAHDLSIILGKTVPVQLFTDSKSIFDIITKLSTVSEKRLLIDISALRQAYTSGEIQNNGHISSEYNIAGPLTEKMNSDILVRLLETGKLNHPVHQWIIKTPSNTK